MHDDKNNSSSQKKSEIVEEIDIGYKIGNSDEDVTEEKVSVETEEKVIEDYPEESIPTDSSSAETVKSPISVKVKPTHKPVNLVNNADDSEETVITETVSREEVTQREELEEFDAFEESEVPKKVVTINVDNSERTSKSALINGKQVKNIMRKASNPILEELKDFNPDPKDIKLFDFDGVDELEKFRKQYIDSSKSLIGPENYSMCPAPYSGYVAHVKSYKYAELVGVQRNASVNDITTQIQEELISIYQHIIKVSFAKDITFDQFLDETFLADLESFFASVYNANNPGNNDYTINCRNCGHSFEHKVHNDDLGFITAAEHNLDEQSVMDVLRHVERKEVKSYNYAKKTVIKKVLPVTRMLINMSMPTLSRYLSVLAWMRSEGHDEDLITIVSKPRFMHQTIDNPRLMGLAIFYRTMLFVDSVGLPVKTEGSSKDDSVEINIRYNKIAKTDDICTILNSLGREDAKALTTGDELSKMFRIGGVSYRINNVTCPSCNGIINFVPLDLRSMVFG